MSLIKRLSIAACTVALAAVAVMALGGCGSTAATWEHGKVTEDEVTQAAESQLSQFMNSDGATYDVDGWQAFIANRSYDADAALAAESADEADATADGEDEAEGTLEEYRAYLIDQIVREQVIDYEIEKADIEVTDDEVDERVDSYAAMYEAYYGGGHVGTFESILEVYMGTDLESFKENVRESLLQEKYEMQVCGVESADEIDAEAFDEYVDGLMAYADIHIKDMPKEVPYDPATLPAGQDALETDGIDAAAVEGEDADAAEPEDGSDADENSEGQTNQ